MPPREVVSHLGPTDERRPSLGGGGRNMELRLPRIGVGIAKRGLMFLSQCSGKQIEKNRMFQKYE